MLRRYGLPRFDEGLAERSRHTVMRDAAGIDVEAVALAGWTRKKLNPPGIYSRLLTR